LRIKGVRSVKSVSEPGEPGTRGRAARSPLGDLLELSPEAMVVVGAGGGVIEANRPAAALFGYRSGELKRMEAARLFSSPTLGRRKNGETFAIEVRSRAARVAGRRVTITSVRAAPLGAAADGPALDSELLASMSHELRTPLNAIIGFAALMHGGKVGPLAPEHREYVGDILASGRRLERLLNDLLDLARGEAGGGDRRLELVDLRRLAGDVSDVLRGLASSRRVRLDIETDPALRPILCDPVLLKQILTRCGSSAVRRSAVNARVRLRIAPVAGAQHRIQVEDATGGTGRSVSRQVLIDATRTGEEQWQAR
jgi:signal transduction histidine kinase